MVVILIASHRWPQKQQRSSSGAIGETGLPDESDIKLLKFNSVSIG